MLTLIMYFLCVYVVFKGVEIFQIGLASSRADRAPAMVVGVLALVASIGVAGIFGYITTEQALEADRQMKSLPGLPKF